ncbi:hypothetical protein ACF0H5_016902 [Mactra antiquata]
MTEESGWGQLVSLTDIESEPVILKTDTLTIGRAFDCDLCLSDNKLVSGHHCCIERNQDGLVSVCDTSTNGTLVGMKKLSKGQRKVLHHGDEIYLVYKKHSGELNVGYIYQDTEELQKEEGTQEYSPPPDILDATLEDSDCNNYSPVKVTASSSNKRKSAADDSDGDSCSSTKKPKVDKHDENTISVKESKDEINEDKETENKLKDEINEESCQYNEVKKQVREEKEGNIEAKQCKKAADINSDNVCDKKDTNKVADDTRDDIEENLQCMICQEIMYDCISLQPCLHSFCAGCYSDWMSRSQECPSCRKKVERINKNHIVNNLIEAYLKEHPGKRRPKEDIDELNQKNKITHDMLYPKEALRYDDSSDYGNTDDDNDDDEPVQPLNQFIGHLPPPFLPPAPQPALFGFGTPVFGATNMYKTICRQCSEYKEPEDHSNTVLDGIKNALNTVKNFITGEDKADDNVAGNVPDQPENIADTGPDEPSTSGNKPGTSGVNPETSGVNPGTSATNDKPAYKDDPKEMPIPPDYVCAPNQNHVLCQCCLQPMPDHRIVSILNARDKKPQQCGVCYRAYCHAYWGCKKADCLGCLNRFKEMNFGRKCLPGLILDNQFESEIFKDYIDSKGLSVKDILQECCRQMEAGRFSVTAQGTHRFTTETPVCYGCGLNSFKQLAFQYRRTLKQEDLPDKALNRADCYWGHKCRTQRNKPHHARNFNHICDQTRQY